MERLQIVYGLTDSGKLHGSSRHLSHRNGGSAPRITVELGQNDAGQTDLRLETLGDVHSVLASHGIHYQEHLVGLDRLLHRSQLLHQVVIDLKATRSVDDQHVTSGLRRLLYCVLGEFRRLSLAVDHDRNIDGPAKRLELIDGGRSLEICRDEQRLLSLRLDFLRQLCGGRGLTRALQANHQDLERCRALLQFRCFGADGPDQLFVDDLDHLLTRSYRLRYILAERSFLDPTQEGLDDSHIDVGFQKCESHLAQGLIDVLLGEFAFASKCGEDRLEPLGQRVEHRSYRLCSVTFQLDTVFLWVSDLDRSVDWYAKLGIQAGERHGDWQNMKLDGQVRFALHEGERPQGPSTAVPSFLVGDLDAEIRRLENLGVEPADPEITDTGVARFTTFTDPDGNQIQLLER